MIEGVDVINSFSKKCFSFRRGNQWKERGVGVVRLVMRQKRLLRSMVADKHPCSSGGAWNGFSTISRVFPENLPFFSDACCYEEVDTSLDSFGEMEFSCI